MTAAIVVMGVSGCGKSTLAQSLAHALGWTFIEGDGCHPPANLAKMAAGIALDDDDRAPFLHAVAAALRGAPAGAVASCSALKRRYRDLLREAGDVLFVLPVVPADELAGRMRTRADHFMPASLLASQLATLEMPSDDERAIVLDGTRPIDALVDEVRAALTCA